MSERTKGDREPIHSMHVDRYLEFIDQSENLAALPVGPVVRPADGTPVLTVEATEWAVFTDRAIPTEQSKVGSQSGDSEKRESA